MVDFRAIIENLVDIGFYSVILPFMLVYVVVFGVLEKSKVFKSDDEKQAKNINAIIAFVFALFVVASIQTVIYIQSLITTIVTFIIFILVVLILLGFIFGDKYMELFMEDGKLKTPIAWIIAGVVLIVAVIMLMVVTGAWDWFLDWIDWDDWDDGSDTFWTVVVIVLIGLVMFWVSREDSKKDK